MINKPEPIRSKKIRDSARGETCAMQVVGVCNHDPDTVVFCHLNELFAGKGASTKADDVAGFYACGACHHAYDEGEIEDEYFYLLRAMYRTWRRLIEKGVIKL